MLLRGAGERGRRGRRMVHSGLGQLPDALGEREVRAQRREKHLAR